MELGILGPLEVRDGLAKVVSLLDFKRAREQAVLDGSGDAGGDEAKEALDRR